MFSVDSTRTWVDPSEGEVVGLISSLNQPLVQAAPDRPTEPTQAYIITRQLASGFEVLVYFHLLDSNVPVIYSDDESPVDEASVPESQDVAQELVLSMGFLIENRNIEGLPAAERGEMIKDLPPFHQDLSPFAREEDELGGDLETEVDEVEEFARARQARIEAGQADPSKFVPEPSDDFELPPTEDGLPPLVQGEVEEEAPLVQGQVEEQAPLVRGTHDISDLDQMEFTGELEAIPDDESSQLDALLDEVGDGGGEATATVVSEGEPTTLEPTVEPLEDVEPLQDVEPLEDTQIEDVEIAADALGPLDVDELLDEVSKPGEGLPEASFQELSDLDVPAVEEAEPFETQASQQEGERGLGDATMNELLDAVDEIGGEAELEVDDLFNESAEPQPEPGLDAAAEEAGADDFEIQIDDEDVFVTPEELIGDEPDVFVEPDAAEPLSGANGSADHGVPISPQFVEGVPADDLVRLLTLL